ncbi:hydroxyisourate hydrolase [Azohydromonas lata]|uniref:hydroxyisourate hydrolase n=1 Tax=Azohydromonas lata TaxID=45677 RepID=UPI000833C950|nr:hydroxyisourate hydrolase [Azohydromonas lata]
MAGISTHVLDNHGGRPGAGMRIDFSMRRDGRWQLVKTLRTNADGRTDEPVLSADAAQPGEYELSFHVAEFYERQGLRADEALFVDQTVPVRFAIADVQQHYHVPLLCTPWSASTYRGS